LKSIYFVFRLVRVYDRQHIRINFDGWGETFNYDVETDSADIHPCGYWEYVQRVLYKNNDTTRVQPHFTFKQFDKPKCRICFSSKFSRQSRILKSLF